MNDVRIRSVVAADFAEWSVLWDGYNAFYGRQGATALPDAVTQVTWSRFFDGYEPMHALVAEQDGRLLGLAHFLFHRTTLAIASTCYLQDLFTANAARGRGVGRALITEVASRARAAHAQRLYWLTHESNHTAMKLYDKVADKSGFLVYRKSL